MNDAYKILREIRTLAPDWFKVPYLVPMTNTIERCRQYVDSENDSDSAFRIIELTDQLQQIELDVGLFIAIENGKPLSRPIHIGRGIAEQAEADAWKVYRKAQDNVIFDGWTKIGGVLENTRGDILWWQGDCIHLEIKAGVEEYISTNLRKITNPKIEDLAKITSDNPLDLK